MKSNNTNFIRRLQRQEEDALEYIVDNYLPLIKGVTYKVLSPLNNLGVMEECINDVFLSIWNNSNKFNGNPTDFRKWICAIAKFKSIDYYRKASKDMVLPSDLLDLKAVRSAEDELIMLENRTELIELINQLELIDREIFILKYFLGFSTNEISIKLGITKAAIDNRIYRGKKTLNNNATNIILGENGI